MISPTYCPPRTRAVLAAITECLTFSVRTGEMQQDSDGRNLASADSRANPPTDHESPDELDDWDDDWDENDDDYENDDHEGPDGPDDWNPVGFGAAASISRDAYLSYTKEKKRLKNAKDKAREKEKKAAVKAAAMVPPAETVPSVKPSSSKSNEWRRKTESPCD